MKLKSIGIQTDLLFRQFDGEVIEKEEYIVIRTSKNPGYRWGNFLVFSEPPKAGDLETWKTVFANEIGTPPIYKHFVFGWDDTEGRLGDIQPFLDAGFKLDKSEVLTTQSVNPPPKLNTQCIIRTFNDKDWEDWIKLEMDMNQAEPERNKEDDEGFKNYLQGKVNEYKGMILAGLGQWFGAFVEGELASSLGLFVWNKLGRFQMVATHPTFRRQGLAGTLVYHVAQQGFAEMGAETLVICADPNYVALDIYKSVGFKTTETIAGVDWHEI